jgi:FkbM family methyltransferase
MQTIFDIGMYDGADTAYYLASGYRVVGVEANPATVQAVEARFAGAIQSGQLTIEPVAVSDREGSIRLHLRASDAGSCSTHPLCANYPEQFPDAVDVPAVPLRSLFARYGLPHYLKVDIEGADHVCIEALDWDAAPAFVSFEMGPDADQLIQHLADIGYVGFKLISQVTFRERARLDLLRDRVATRIRHTLGRQTLRRAGRDFIPEHSSGPMPCVSDGRWRSAADARACWRQHLDTQATVGGWYDCHARHQAYPQNAPTQVMPSL